MTVVVAGAAAWLCVLAVTVLWSRPARLRPEISAAPGDEPPAVVDLLVNRWCVTPAAARATLLDLAARGLVALTLPHEDINGGTIRRTGTTAGELLPYERRLLDHVTAVTRDGRAPLGALQFRSADDAARWRSEFRAQVIADARRRGLSRRRFSGPVAGLLLLAALVPAAAGLATADGSPTVTVPVGITVTAVLVVLTTALRGERDTPAGRAAAARWLAYRDRMADGPPPRHRPGDRARAYALALGRDVVGAGSIDLGAGDPGLIWSAYGGYWRQVRVRYPGRWRPRFGFARLGATTPALVLRVWVLAASAGLIGYFVIAGPFSRFGEPWLWWPLTVVAVALVSAAGYLLVRTLLDLADPATVTGEVLASRPWRYTADDDPVPVLHHLAVDDGRHDETVGWVCPSGLAAQAASGAIVQIRVRRWSRRVISLTVLMPGATPVRPTPTGVAAPADNPVVAAARRISAAVGAADTVWDADDPFRDVGPADVVTEADVARAYGHAVRAAGWDRSAHEEYAGSSEAYRDARTGRKLLSVELRTGLTGRLIITNHRRRGEPVPGIGDEAYLARRWAAARRGGHVLLIRTHGGSLDPHALSTLLAAGTTRLGTRVPRV